jgi:hypothetical protein
MRNTVIFRNDHAAIIVESPTYGRHEVLIDKEDVAKFHEYKIRIGKEGQLYAQFSKDGKNIKVHKCLTNSIGMGNSVHVRHLNGNSLDNRRCNLALGTNRDNQVDRYQHENLKGYCWDKHAKAWKSQIGINGHVYYLGSFASELKASEIVQVARLLPVTPDIGTRLEELRIQYKQFRHST